MTEAITATYVQEDEDWTITVAGLGKELTGRAPGIIAARDRADQLVEKLAPEGQTMTVVHLLDGSALEFTTAYMTARLTRPTPAPEQADEADDANETSADEAAATDAETGDAETEEAATTPEQRTGADDEPAGTADEAQQAAADADRSTSASATG